MIDWSEATFDEPEQSGEGLFGPDGQFHKDWQYWHGMPEFVSGNLEPEAEITVKFRTLDDVKRFGELISQPVRYPMPQGIWYPEREIEHYWDKRYRDASADETEEAR